MNRPNALDEGDLFSAFFLALKSFHSEKDNGEEFQMHSVGFRLIMAQLETRNDVNYDLRLFWHFARMCLEAVTFSATNSNTFELSSFSVSSFQSVYGHESYEKMNMVTQILKQHQQNVQPRDWPPLEQLHGQFPILLIFDRRMGLQHIVREALDSTVPSGDSSHRASSDLSRYEFQSPFDNEKSTIHDAFMLLGYVMSGWSEFSRIPSSRAMEQAEWLLNDSMMELFFTSVNRFMCMLLAAPSVIDGLLSPEAFALGQSIAGHILRFVGAGCICDCRRKRRSNYPGQQGSRIPFVYLAQRIGEVSLKCQLPCKFWIELTPRFIMAGFSRLRRSQVIYKMDTWLTSAT